MIGVMKLL